MGMRRVSLGKGGELMFQYEKVLQYPVNIKTPNPALAKVIISQLGGHKTKKIRKPLRSHAAEGLYYAYFIKILTNSAPISPVCL